jgi:hypothetical protein
MSIHKVRAIAFYLPQFYPTPENDEWWEPGFTEWTNVAKAKPLFKGHVQPKIPRDLSFYDLRVPETREKQAELAREAGIEGFCYWHYWFSGRRLLDRVFTEVVESGQPDYPFCLCWANHSWYQKTWDPTKPDKLLIEQTYPGEQDYINHFNAMLPAFKDKRYMKVDGKLIFGIFDSDHIKDFAMMKEIWNKMARDNGLNGFYFFGFCQGEHRLEKAKSQGYDTIVYEHMPSLFFKQRENVLVRGIHRLFRYPYVVSYDKYLRSSISFFANHPCYTPCIIPNFDHTPRSSYRGILLNNSTPDKWCRICQTVYNHCENYNIPLLFIKSWNEWGEGNYLEPDSKYGKQYIEQTAKALSF